MGYKYKLIFLFLMCWGSNLVASDQEQSYDQAISESLEPNADVENQVKGDYPLMSRKESLPLGAIQHIWDNDKKGAGIYTVDFNPREIIKVRLREYMTTTLSLPHWEKIASYELGDEGAYFVKRINDSTLTIKTYSLIGTDTSLTVFGESGQIYGFYLRAEGYNSKNISDIIVYVQAPLCLKMTSFKKTQTIDSDSQDFIEDSPINPVSFDFNYTMAGDPSIAPKRVYTDGIRTWFDYGESLQKQDLPVIFAVVDGVDTPLNVHRDGNVLVAHGTGKFTLKHGKKLVCVYPTCKD